MLPHAHITLSELQRLVKETLHERFALPVWVSAEISEVKVNYSGHCYLELIEKGGDNGVPLAQSRAVIWRTAYSRIAGYFEAETGQRLAAGIKILAKVAVNYHELYGFSLQITDIDPAYTLGDMQRQRQQTIDCLHKEGVWDMNREVGMPAVVQRIAIVSSANAAGYQDFCKEIGKSPYRFRLTLFDAFMQGAAAEESIVAALCAVADRMEEFDAVVIIRGGGSASDLNCFNAYRLCTHVAQFPLPVLTGIGHDKDTSVADMVAHTALKNPDGGGRVAGGADGHDRRMARQRRPATARQRTGHLAGTGTAASGAVQPPALPCQGAAQTTGDGPGADARNPRGQCREFPRTPGVPARQCGRTGRRTLPGAYPAAGLRHRPHGRQSRFTPPHKSEKATRSTSRSPTAASRAPFNTPKRNDPAMKEDTPFRIAFCVLCHKYTPVLAELVHQLDAPGNGLFIHVDGKADIGAFAALGKTGRVCFVEPRTKVYWGGFGMVESTLRLFSATRDGGFRYVVLISGDTLPLYPAETIRTVLREAYDRGRQFISANPSITPEEADRIRRRRFCPDKATFARRLLRIAMKCTMRADNPFFDRLPPLEKGSQWIAITDRMRDFIFDYLAAHPDFIPAFRYSHAADELFFHTLLGDSPFAGHNANYSLVYADWSHPGAHPKTLSTSDLSQLSVLKSRGGGNSPLFARKFDDGLDIARYREILFGQGTKAAR